MDENDINNDLYASRFVNRTAMHVNNALIEQINHDGRTSFVTISYGVPGDFNVMHMEIVTLIVDRNTIITNRRGRRISPGDLSVGNIIDASFSTSMTRSIPPQSRAFRIRVVREGSRPVPPSFDVSEGRIIDVDARNNFLLTGDPDDIMSQIRFVIDSNAEIFDRRGNRISLRDLRPGQMVRIEHANFMTASIPPQTTAFRIWII